MCSLSLLKLKWAGEILAHANMTADETTMAVAKLNKFLLLMNNGRPSKIPRIVPAAAALPLILGLKSPAITGITAAAATKSAVSSKNKIDGALKATSMAPTPKAIVEILPTSTAFSGAKLGIKLLMISREAMDEKPARASEAVDVAAKTTIIIKIIDAHGGNRWSAMRAVAMDGWGSSKL